MLQSNTIKAIIALLLALLVQGCGRKNPLFLPPQPLKPTAENKEKVVPPGPIASQVAPSLSLQPGQAIQNQSETQKQP